MSDPNGPTLLMECANAIEAGAVKSLLVQNDIPVTLQTEHANAILPHFNIVMAPRLLVLEKDLERAKALLDSQPSSATEGAGIDGGVCAVHEKPALAICTRCGSFLCAECGSLGDPPVCESCLEAEKLPERNRGHGRAEFYISLAILAAIVIAVLIGGVMRAL